MPQIEMTPAVKFVLIGLRVYLLVMLVLIALKFYMTFSKAEQHPRESPPAAQTELLPPSPGKDGQVPSAQSPTAK